MQKAKAQVDTQLNPHQRSFDGINRTVLVFVTFLVSMNLWRHAQTKLEAVLHLI